MSIWGYQQGPGWAEGAELPVLEGVRVLEEGARAVDRVTLEPMLVTQGHAQRHEPIAENPLQWAQGAFVYHVGLTTLTVVTHNTLSASVDERYRVRVNGVVRSEYLMVSGDQTANITGMASWGLTAGQVVEVTVEVYDAGSTEGGDLPAGRSYGTYRLVDWYVSPVSACVAAPSWDPPPSFSTATDTLARADLVAYTAALDWFGRFFAVWPRPLFQSLYKATGLYWPSAAPIWSGGIGGRGPYTRVVIRGRYQIVTNSAERIRIAINGTVITQTAALAAGASGPFTFTLGLGGYAATTPLRLDLDSLIEAAPAGVGQPSRYDLFGVELGYDAPALGALPTTTAPAESLRWDVLAGRLNTIRTLLIGARDRIANNPAVFDRQRLFRRNYGYNAGQQAYFAARYVPLRENRAGRWLIARGRNMRLGWGAVSVVPPQETGGEYALEMGDTLALAGGDAFETKTLSLDAQRNLLEGRAYVVQGPETRYAGEVLWR